MILYGLIPCFFNVQTILKGDVIINLLYCETFLIVCSYGNFTEAAKQLYVPQPTITNRIRYLEEEMGQELFVRKKGKRSAELTKAGKKFHVYAQQVIENFNTVKFELNQDTNENLIAIGSSIALTHPYIYEKISMLNDVHNNNINLLIMDHSLIAKSLTDGIIDMAFVTEPIINNQLDSYPVHKEKLGLIVSKKHPLARKKSLKNITDLENEYLIFYKPFFKYLTTVKNINCKKRITTNQIELINDLIHNLNGVALLPPNTFDTEIKKGALVHIPIDDEILNCEIQYFIMSRKYEIFYKEIFL